MASTENEIIHPINAPIFNRALKTISLPIAGGFGFNQVLSIVQTYPVLIPRLGQYAKLETKSEKVEQLYAELRKVHSSIIVSRLHNFDESNRFVSWGKLETVSLPDKLYSVYLDALDLFLSSNKPIFLKKKDSFNGFVIKSARFNHSVHNDTFGYSEKANVSLSSVLVRFTKYTFKAKEFIIGKGVPPLMSVDAEVGFFIEGKLQFHSIRLAMTSDMLEFVKKSGIGVYACYVYSVNDWIRGPRQKPELNLIVHLREIFYSPDSIFPFFGDFSHETPYSYLLTMSESTVKTALQQLKYKTDYATKEIERITPLYRYRSKDGKFMFHILKPWVVFSLITAYALDPPSRESVSYVLGGDDILGRIKDIIKSSFLYLPTGHFVGNYSSNVMRQIKESIATRDL